MLLFVRCDIMDFFSGVNRRMKTREEPGCRLQEDDDDVACGAIGNAPLLGTNAT
jgi:hypothetical protein